MNKKKISAILLLLLFILTISFNLPFLKSLSIMYFYSIYEDQQSIMERKNFTLDIPGGLSTIEKDWYPLVMTFHDDTIASAIGEEIELTILYNFGAFEKGRSLFYCEDSDYYSSFYGGYIIESKNSDRNYGYQNGEIVVSEIVKIAAYDLNVLVLESIGCKDPEVEFQSLGDPKEVNYLSYDDWIVIDSVISSKGTMHKVKRNYQAYIQYGKPPKNYSKIDFPNTKLAGRIYCRYFPQHKVTILLYIIAPNFDVIDKTDKQILSKTKIYNTNLLIE